MVRRAPPSRNASKSPVANRRRSYESARSRWKRVLKPPSSYTPKKATPVRAFSESKGSLSANTPRRTANLAERAASAPVDTRPQRQRAPPALQQPDVSRRDAPRGHGWGFAAVLPEGPGGREAAGQARTGGSSPIGLCGRLFPLCYCTCRFSLSGEFLPLRCCSPSARADRCEELAAKIMKEACWLFTCSLEGLAMPAHCKLCAHTVRSSQ